jgi:cytochrome c biogenesis protein CcmG/thiol:disulfide interchange protein DsbE
MENNEKWVDDSLATLGGARDWQPDEARGLARLGEQLRARRVRRRRWALTAGLVGAICVSLPALPLTRVLAKQCVETCVVEASRVSDLLWHKAPASGRIAPDFVLMDAAGKPVQLSSFRGKVVLLNFWATWCPPCKAEIPWFIEFQRTFGDRGLVVLGISLDDDGWKSVAPFAVEKKINYPVMLGNADVARLYGGVKSLPMTLIVDRFGNIVATYTGLIVGKHEYEAEIRGALGE